MKTEYKFVDEDGRHTSPVPYAAYEIVGINYFPSTLDPEDDTDVAGMEFILTRVNPVLNDDDVLDPKEIATQAFNNATRLRRLVQ